MARRERRPRRSGEKFDLDGQIFRRDTELPPCGGRNAGDGVPTKGEENVDIIERIEYMEALFDRAKETGEIPTELTDYYFGGQWLLDYQADERGELPRDLKRGVLSQDGIWNLLE